MVQNSVKIARRPGDQLLEMRLFKGQSIARKEYAFLGDPAAIGQCYRSKTCIQGG